MMSSIFIQLKNALFISEAVIAMVNELQPSVRLSKLLHQFIIKLIGYYIGF